MKQKNYFVEEIDQNELMSKKHKKVCMTLNYVEDLLVFASAIARYILISAFASLAAIQIAITSSTLGLKIFAITAAIKKYKSLNYIKVKYFKVNCKPL